MQKKISITIVVVSLLTFASFALTLPTRSSDVQPVSKEKGAALLGPRLLVEEWRFHMFWRYQWGYFGSSPAIADLGPDVNAKGEDPDLDLEIVTGSDEYCHHFSELGAFASGIME